MNIDNSVGKSPKDRAPLSPLAAAVAWTFIIPRDALARLLLKMRITPNGMTVLGVGLTGVAAGYLAKGASQGWSDDYPGSMPYPAIAGIWLFWVCGADMLDGAMARLGGKATPFGAFLDSIIDRYCDILLFLGIGFYYARFGNLTYQLLATVGMANALLISYTKARAEDFIPSCRIGFWERGERVAALLIASCFGGIPAVLWELAIFPFFTALRRIQFTHWAIRTASQGIEFPRDLTGKLTDGSLFDRCRRGSVTYDLVTGAYIAFIIFAPIDNTDLFRQWFG